MRSVTLHKTYKYIFENEFFTTTAVQHGQHVDALGIHTFFSRLVSVFVDILYFPTGCIKLVVGALHPFLLSFPGYGSGSDALLAEVRFQS